MSNPISFASYIYYFYNIPMFANFVSMVWIIHVFIWCTLWKWWEQR